jgi:hypothetical protein
MWKRSFQRTRREPCLRGILHFESPGVFGSRTDDTL